jgi:hypothetical protein
MERGEQTEEDDGAGGGIMEELKEAQCGNMALKVDKG